MRIGLLASLLLVLAGCAHAQIQVAHGTLGAGGTWSALVYEGGGDLGVCLQIRATDREADRLCSLRADNAGLWQPGGPTDGVKFVVVTTPDQAAFGARIALARGREVRTSFGEARSLTELRFFVIALPSAETPSDVEILDGNGAVHTTLPLE